MGNAEENRRPRLNARPFPDRAAAGRALAQVLGHYGGRPDLLVLALPRGGVPVAYEIARHLRAPLDVFIVRKLGLPGHEELAMGAIASGGVRVINEDIVRQLRLSSGLIEAVAQQELRELERREQLYRQGPRWTPQGRTVILVDDGLATGSTMRAALEAVRRQGPARLVVAVPVGAPETCASLEGLADEVVCLLEPEDFDAVGRWYEDFRQTSDEEVRRLLGEAGGWGRAG